MTCRTKCWPASTTYAIRSPSGAQAIATTFPPAGCDQALRPSGAIAINELPMPAATKSACGDSATALTGSPCRRKPPFVTIWRRPSTIAAMPFAPIGSVSCAAAGRGLAFAPRLTCSAPAAARAPAAITSRTTTAANARTAVRRPRRGGATGCRERSARCSASSPAPGSGSGASANIASSRRSTSLDMLDLQRLTQLLEGAGEPGIDGADRKVERFCDLLRRHADPVAEDDHDAPLELELGHGGEQAPVSCRMRRCKIRRVRQLLV